jgi:hypothetical protein
VLFEKIFHVHIVLRNCIVGVIRLPKPAINHFA